MELAGAGDMDAAPKGERAGASESTAATCEFRHSCFVIPRRNATRSHLVSDRPEIVKNRSEKRFFQKRNAGRTAGAVFRANGALDQFNVAISPFLESFVEIGHQLEQDRNFGRRFVELQNLGLHLLAWP